MKPEYLDSYQRKALKLLEQNDFLFLQGKKDSGKTYLLNHLIREALFNDQRVLFISESPQEISSFGAMMHAHKLDDQLITFKAGTFPDPDDLGKIPIALKFKKKEQEEDPVAGIEIEQKSIVGKISRYYDRIDSKVLFGKKWHELVVLQAFDRHSRTVLYYNYIIQPKAFKFNQEEYDTMLDAVVSAYDFYEQKIALTDHRYAAHVYNMDMADQAWQAIEHWLTNARKRTLKIISSINHYLQQFELSQRRKFVEITESYKNEIEQYLVSLDQLTIELEKESARYAQGSIFSSKKGKLKQLREKIIEILDHLNILAESWNEMGSDFFSAPSFEDFSFSEDLSGIKDQLNIWLEYFSNNRPDMMMYVRQKIDAININQSEDPDISKLEQEIEGLYSWLDENNVLNKKHESTAFSLATILYQLESILEELNQYLLNPAPFKQFYSWNKFYFSLDNKHRSLIDKLLIIQPDDWIAFFRNWYVQNMLDISSELYREDIDELLHNYEQNLARVNDSIHNSFLANQQINTQEHLSENASGRSSLRKYFSGKKQFPDWSELLKEHDELIFTMYPVLITTIDQFSELPDFNWDLVVIKLKKWDDNYLALIDPMLEKYKKLIVSVQIDGAQETIFPTFTNKVPSFTNLEGNHLQNIISLQDMNHTERLHGARNLAHIIQDIKPDISIFHLEKYIIFSCLSKPLNTVLLKLLDQRGVKKMRDLESPFHSLVENLLEISSPRILLTQDSLLNMDMESLDWQLFAIQRIKKAGIQIVDFKTRQLLSNPLQELIKFTETYFPKEL